MGLARKSRPGLPARLLEAGLWLAAAGCGISIVSHTVEARQTQRTADAIEPGTATADDVLPKAGSVIGKLEISQIGLSVPMLESYDPATLVRGVGHVQGTAVPGGLGNMVLAGHRDTFFRPLRNVKAGMQIQVATRDGRWRYDIDSMEVVTPNQVQILDIGSRPEMTLITCYPFEYVGAAPKRFIVHAHLLSVEAN